MPSPCGRADELDGEREAAARRSPRARDAAGWPVEFQSTPNGTHALSHRYVAVAPRPSIICAGTAGADIIGISSTSWSSHSRPTRSRDPLLGHEQPLDQPVGDQRAGAGDVARAPLEPLLALDLDARCRGSRGT